MTRKKMQEHLNKLRNAIGNSKVIKSQSKISKNSNKTKKNKTKKNKTKKNKKFFW